MNSETTAAPGAEKFADIAALLVTICHRVEEKGFVSATDGNVSARLANGNILATPSSLNKGHVSVADLVELTAAGEIVSGSKKVSTEIDMHRYIYQNRHDVGAVVHCHPPYATGFAAARLPLTECIFPEVIVGFGSVPLADYATPSTPEVAQSIAPFVDKADAILLANHGVVTYGKDLWDAYFKMEKVEHTAHILFVARMLGGEKILTSEQVEALKRVAPGSYGKDLSETLSCSTVQPETAFELSDAEYKSIVEEVKRRIDQTFK
jgi:L-fuculose-phosphate aldolase